MTRKELLENILDAMQRDEDTKENMQLEQIEEWDSLAIISILNLYSSLFSISISGNTLKECKTIKDVIDIVADKLEDK